MAKGAVIKPGTYFFAITAPVICQMPLANINKLNNDIKKIL